MSFQMFHEICPEIGFRETRSVTLPADSGHDLPADAYAFLEMYCADAGCDCRRSMSNASNGTTRCSAGRSMVEQRDSQEWR